MSEKKEFTDRFSDFEISDLIFEISLKNFSKNVSDFFANEKREKNCEVFRENQGLLRDAQWRLWIHRSSAATNENE